MKRKVSFLIFRAVSPGVIQLKKLVKWQEMPLHLMTIIVRPSPIGDIRASGKDSVMLVPADSGDDIVYLKTSAVPGKIDEGLGKRNLTRYQVAQIRGVSRSYVTRVSDGERTTSVEMAKRIGLLPDFDWRIFYRKASESTDCPIAPAGADIE